MNKLNWKEKIAVFIISVALGFWFVVALLYFMRWILGK
jgi:hypothetical protein